MSSDNPLLAGPLRKLGDPVDCSHCGKSVALLNGPADLPDLWMYRVLAP